MNKEVGILIGLACVGLAVATSWITPNHAGAENKPSATAPVMALPIRYQHDFALIRFMGQPHFECDYTSHRCIRGVRGDGNIVGEVLDDKDRTTVLGHVGIGAAAHGFINYDTGEARFEPGPLVGTIPDMPADCLDKEGGVPVTTHGRCTFSPNDPVPLASQHWG